MNIPRFLRKTTSESIAASIVIAVMLLSFTASCSREHKEFVALQFDPETTPTMLTTEVSSLISDSGVVKYKLIAQEWHVYGKAAEPYWYFPEKIYLEQYDSLFNPAATIRADTAYNYEKQGLWKLIGNVDIVNERGDHFETSLLYWDTKDEKVYSDQFMHIERADGTIIEGNSFESNWDMTKYRIWTGQGAFPINETDSVPPADSTQVDPLPDLLLNIPRETTAPDQVVVSERPQEQPSRQPADAPMQLIPQGTIKQD